MMFGRLFLSVMVYQVGLSLARETWSEIVTRMKPQLWERAEAVRRLAVPLADEQFHQLTMDLVRQRVPVHAESEECRVHSQHIVNAITRGETWSLRMLDSSTNLPSGLLQGQLVDFGYYPECIETQEPNKLFKGKYCFVATKDIIPRELHLYMNHDTSSVPEEYQQYLSHPKDLTFALCVPSSCSARDVQAHVNHVLAPINASAAVFDHYCSTDSDTLPFSLKDWFAIAVYSSIVLAVCGATLADLRTGADKSAVVSSLSLFRSWSQLTNVRAADEITSMAGIRVIVILVIIIGHVALRDLSEKSLSPLAIEQASLTWMELACRTIEVLLVLGGVSRAYSFMRDRAREKPFETKFSILRRYIRYTPVLAILVLFYATLFIRCGSGPFWKNYLHTSIWGCCNFWFTNLLHISNLFNLGVHCMGYSWYLAVDFQLFIVSSYLLKLLHFEPWTGLQSVGAVIAMSVFAFTLAAIDIEVDAPTISYVYKNRLKNEVNLLYTNPFYRLSTYLIGITLGYFLFTSGQSKHRIKLSKPVLWLGWLVSVAAITATWIISSTMLEPDYQRIPWLDVGYTVLSKLAIAAAACWLVAVCHLGYGGVLNRFLSWRGFQTLSKLTLGVYLVHIPVIQMQSNRVKTLQYFDSFYSFHKSLGVVVLSYLVAVVLFLFVEVPCSSLFNSYLRKPITTSATNENLLKKQSEKKTTKKKKKT